MWRGHISRIFGVGLEASGLTVTTVSLAPANPPARMLVSVDVFCVLVMIVNAVQKSEVFGEKEPP